MSMRFGSEERPLIRSSPVSSSLICCSPNASRAGGADTPLTARFSVCSARLKSSALSFGGSDGLCVHRAAQPQDVFADHPHVAVILSGLLFHGLRPLFAAVVAMAFRHLPIQCGALHQRSDRGPKGVLQIVRHAAQQRLWRVGMSDMATELLRHSLFIQLPQRAAALRAGVGCRLAGASAFDLCSEILLNEI